MADIAPNKSLFIGQYFSTLILPASLARSFCIVRSLLCIVEWLKHLWLLCTSANSIPLSCDNQNPQFSLVAQSYLILCDPVDCSTTGLPVHHQHLEFTQTHVHWVGDTIQPSHPPSFPSRTILNLSQHQSLFQWVSSSHEVAKVLEFQL